MDLPGLEELLTSFVTAIRGQIKAEKALKRLKEVTKAYDALGQDVPTADIKIALEGEK
jgi:hypothetical protein